MCLRLCLDFYVLSGEFSHIVCCMKGVSSLTTRERRKVFILRRRVKQHSIFS